MIQVTLQFRTLAAAVKALSEIPEASIAGQSIVMEESTPLPKIESPKAEKQEAATPSGKSGATPARTSRTAEAVEVAAPAKTAGASSPTAASAEAAPQASTAATDVEVSYADLQKAVAKLHSLDKTAALPIAKAHGFDTFLPLKDPANAGHRAAVLDAVKAALEALGA